MKSLVKIPSIVHNIYVVGDCTTLRGRNTEETPTTKAAECRALPVNDIKVGATQTVLG